MDSQERWTRRPIRRPRGGVCSSPRSMTCAISTRQRAIFGGSCRRRLRIARHRHRPWPLPKTQAEVRCSTTTTVRCRVRRSKSRVTSGSPWANSGRSRRGKGSSWCVCVFVGTGGTHPLRYQATLACPSLPPLPHTFPVLLLALLSPLSCIRLASLTFNACIVVSPPSSLSLRAVPNATSPLSSSSALPIYRTALSRVPLVRRTRT